MTYIFAPTNNDNNNLIKLNVYSLSILTDFVGVVFG